MPDRSSDQQAIAVVPAAGIGLRMHSDVPKQYLDLLGVPVIERTIRTLLACDFIESVVVGIAANDQHWQSLLIANHPNVSKVEGGDTRAQTVENCLLHIDNAALNDQWLLVHDAVRPCITEEAIRTLWEQRQSQAGGGILSLPIADTIKRANGDKRILATVDRSELWAAQTPQMFKLKPLLDALVSARQNKAAITDEASAMELAGWLPQLVAGNSRNIKITQADDLSLAALILREQGVA